MLVFSFIITRKKVIKFNCKAGFELETSEICSYEIQLLIVCFSTIISVCFIEFGLKKITSS